MIGGRGSIYSDFGITYVKTVECERYDDQKFIPRKLFWSPSISNPFKTNKLAISLPSRSIYSLRWGLTTILIGILSLDGFDDALEYFALENLVGLFVWFARFDYFS